MSALETILAIALALTSWLLFRLYRKHLILRHVFIHSSDWSARKIEALARSATDQLTSLAIDDAAGKGSHLTESEARGFVNFEVLDATKEWQAQADAMQARLRRNGIRPLDEHDLDSLMWRPWIAGIKP